MIWADTISIANHIVYKLQLVYIAPQGDRRADEDASRRRGSRDAGRMLRNNGGLTERDGPADVEGFGAGVAVAEGAVGEMGETDGEAVAVAELPGQFDAGAEFEFEAEVEVAAVVVVAGAEAGGKEPAAAQVEVEQDAAGGVDRPPLPLPKKNQGPRWKKRAAGRYSMAP